MKKRMVGWVKLTALTAGSILALGASAEGQLNIYNWSDYTPPDLVEKFEQETGITVTVDTYDSNETLLAKLQSGATGYDLAPVAEWLAWRDERNAA